MTCPAAMPDPGPRHDASLQMPPRQVFASQRHAHMLGKDAAAAGRAKGLDMALLAQQKRRIEDASADVDLDAARAEGQRAAQAKAEAVARAAEHRAKFRKLKQETPDIVYIHGKRMRKKKKAPPPEQPPPTKEMPLPSQAPAPALHEDPDIFGEVGVWDGLSETEPSSTVTPSTSHDWFGTPRRPSPAPPT